MQLHLANPFDVVDRFLDIERRLRAGESFVAADEIDDPYWADIVRLLQAFWAREWDCQDFRVRPGG